jgi:hypothetical protein
MSFFHKKNVTKCLGHHYAIICTWMNVFRIFEGHRDRFRESCKSVEKIFEGGEVHFFVKIISSSSFLSLKKNNITIWSEIMWKVLFLVKFYRRFDLHDSRNRSRCPSKIRKTFIQVQILVKPRKTKSKSTKLMNIEIFIFCGLHFEKRTILRFEAKLCEKFYF